MCADQDLADLGPDVVGPDRAFLEREQVVPRLVHGRLAPVDEEGRVGDRGRVELPRRREAGADCVHVRARLQPLAVEHGLGGVRHRDDDVRAADGRLD